MATTIITVRCGNLQFRCAVKAFDEGAALGYARYALANVRLNKGRCEVVGVAKDKRVAPSAVDFDTLVDVLEAGME